jgi:ferredoxin/flavodoxin
MLINVAIVYFSATGITESFVSAIGKELEKQDCLVTKINITSKSFRESKDARIKLDSFDYLIFGFPVFKDFAPEVVENWLASLNGSGRKSVMFFTYGGRTTGYAHYHTKILLENAGFKVGFTAEFLGRHSINLIGWRALPGRPNEEDFTIARNFAVQALRYFSETKISEPFILQKPFGYDIVINHRLNQSKPTERTWCNPLRISDSCSMCRKCEEECPSGAIDADSGMSDIGKCIECLHCVYICPDQVLKGNEKIAGHYPIFLKNFNMTDKFMNFKKSKIITSGLDTAF